MGTKWQQNLKVLLALSLIFFVLMFSGCATFKPSALNPDTKAIDISNESIALLTIKVANDYKPDYQPHISNIVVKEKAADNSEKLSFKVNEAYSSVEKSFNEHLISFQLPAGTYTIRECFAQSGSFLLLGNFTVPIYSTFSIESNKIIYLGHIEATVKKRTDDKALRAGPIIPLLDQAATGASGGTFVIKITDLFEKDIALFKEKYPYLSDHKIENLTLPQRAQLTKEDLQ